MSEIESLMQRIDAEFNAADDRLRQLQSQNVQAYHDREQRLQSFAQVCERMRETWRPRLEALAKRFGDKVQVTPSVTPTSRQAVFAFQSPLANIRLRFSVTSNTDVTEVIFNYDLEILPIFMQFQSHLELAMPLDAIDDAKMANWFDDRILQFVRTYLSVHENQYYLKGHLVKDPIALVEFPRHAAAASLEWQGKTHYFISDETRTEFARRNTVS